MEPIKQPWRWLNDKEVYCHWQRPTHEWNWLPSSKVTMCLMEGDCKQFSIVPDLSLWRYNCDATEEQYEAVEKWAGDRPYVLFHYEGHSCPEKKNLSRGCGTHD